MDRRLWEFYKRAEADGLSTVFTKNEAPDIRGRLEESDKGKAFMKDFMKVLTTKTAGACNACRRSTCPHGWKIPPRHWEW